MDGRIWGRDIEQDGTFKLQQNVVSHHYRILDQDNRRVYSTFEQEDVFNEWTTLRDTEKSTNEGRESAMKLNKYTILLLGVCCIPFIFLSMYNDYKNYSMIVYGLMIIVILYLAFLAKRKSSFIEQISYLF